MVVACLVQGVYTLERDRQKRRHGPLALAPPWWESFHFQLQNKLIDSKDKSIFGAIYEQKDPSPDSNISKYVIAFRGTIIEPEKVLHDFELDCKCSLNKLQRSSRFKFAMDYVQITVALSEGERVWLAGHSLGSTLALLAGKDVAKTGCFLKTNLFNPPFLSVSIERAFKDENVKFAVHLLSCATKASLSLVIHGLQVHDPFVVLSQWVPYLFVNPADPICSGYIRHFERRRSMEDNGFGKLERRAAEIFIRNLRSGAEALHFLPSADLTINRDQVPDIKGVLATYRKFKELMEFNSGGIFLTVNLWVITTTLQTELNEAAKCVNRPKRQPIQSKSSFCFFVLFSCLLLPGMCLGGSCQIRICSTS